MMDYLSIPHNNINTIYKDKAGMVSAIAYFDRYLLQKAMSVFEWTIPENWDKNYFLYNLYIHGFVCVTSYKKYGIIPQFCTISGFNIYYNPSRCLIANPYLKPESKQVNIGQNGELLRLTPDYRGITDIVNQYSEMLANSLCAVNTNLYNSRMAYMFYAKNKAQAESYKKMYDEIGTGSPAVFVDAKMMREDTATGKLSQPWQPFNANLSSNYIATEILEDMERIEHMFDRTIGLPSTNSQKKERMNDMEVNKSDIETKALISVWYDIITESIKRVKKLYPDLDLNCTYKFEDDYDAEDYKNDVEYNTI